MRLFKEMRVGLKQGWPLQFCFFDATRRSSIPLGNAGCRLVSSESAPWSKRRKLLALS
jgi:hypothetical protein